MLDLLRRYIARQKPTNLELVLGAIDDPRFPADTIDLALMVDVYHEFSEPQKMLRGIRTALRADGRMALIEYRGEDSSGPIRPEHVNDRCSGPRRDRTRGIPVRRDD